MLRRHRHAAAFALQLLQKDMMPVLRFGEHWPCCGRNLVFVKACCCVRLAFNEPLPCLRSQGLGLKSDGWTGKV